MEQEVTISLPGWFPLQGAVLPVLKLLSFCGATPTLNPGSGYFLRKLHFFFFFWLMLIYFCYTEIIEHRLIKKRVNYSVLWKAGACCWEADARRGCGFEDEGSLKAERLWLGVPGAGVQTTQSHLLGTLTRGALWEECQTPDTSVKR